MPSAFRRSGGSNQRKVVPSGISESPLPNRPLSSSLTSSSNRNPIKPSIRPLLQGVKPWQGGSYLTSVGLNDLDSILGGGQVLGTSIVLEEDRLWTRDLAITLVKYWCAEVCFLFFQRVDNTSHLPALKELMQYTSLHYFRSFIV